MHSAALRALPMREESMTNFVETLTPTFFIETGIIYLGLLLGYSFVRGSTGDSALKGVAVLLAVGFVGVYVIANEFELYRIEKLLEQLINVMLLALLVIFQPELRRGVVRLGQNRLFGRMIRKRGDTVQVLSNAAFRLARGKTGALVVIQRGVALGNYVDRGTAIDALISPELLETIFWHGGPLHDGAVLVRDDRILAAGCLLPLSENADVAKRLGTRHRAAIGVSEETDAVGVVVSEETGAVSIAEHGQLHRDLDRIEFEHRLRKLLEGRTSNVESGALNGGTR